MFSDSGLIRAVDAANEAGDRRALGNLHSTVSNKSEHIQFLQHFYLLACSQQHRRQH